MTAPTPPTPANEPADGTDPAALTDEELAEIGRGHEGMTLPFSPEICRRCSHFWPCPIARLIAALRASRAEVERLRATRP